MNKNYVSILHKSSVSSSPLYLWKGPFDSRRLCRRSTRAGCTKNTIQVHRKIGVCTLQSETQASKAFSQYYSKHVCTFFIWLLRDSLTLKIVTFFTQKQFLCNTKNLFLLLPIRSKSQFILKATLLKPNSSVTVQTSLRRLHKLIVSRATGPLSLQHNGDLYQEGGNPPAQPSQSHLSFKKKKRKKFERYKQDFLFHAST